MHEVLYAQLYSVDVITAHIREETLLSRCYHICTPLEVTAPAQDKHTSLTASWPFWDGCPLWLEKAIKWYYTIAQFQASSLLVMTGSSLFDKYMASQLPCASRFCRYMRTGYVSFPTSLCMHTHTHTLTLIFEVIFPFQFASFLMTLVRKGIITTKGFHAGYLWSLWMVVWLILGPQNFNVSAASFGVWITLYIWRSYGLSKYALWLGPLLSKMLAYLKVTPDLPIVGLATMTPRDSSGGCAFLFPFFRIVIARCKLRCGAVIGS